MLVDVARDFGERPRAVLDEDARVVWRVSIARAAAKGAAEALPGRAEQAIGERHAIEDVDRRGCEAAPRKFPLQPHGDRSIAARPDLRHHPTIFPIVAIAIDELETG